jgi:flagellar assembly factor FliW
MTAATALAEPVLASSPVQTNLFGTLFVRDEDVLDFREGLLGFSRCTRWLLLEGKKPGTAWLQSADIGALAFLLIDPFTTFDGYTAHLGPSEVRQLDANDPSQIAVFAIVTLPSSNDPQPTANLRGPVVINVSSRLGAQVLSSAETWSVRQPLPPAALE